MLLTRLTPTVYIRLHITILPEKRIESRFFLPAHPKRHLSSAVLGFYFEVTVKGLWFVVMIVSRELKLSNSCLCSDRQKGKRLRESADLSCHVEFCLRAGQPHCGWEVEEVCDTRGRQGPAAAGTPTRWKEPAEVNQATGKDAIQRGRALSDPGCAGEITVYLWLVWERLRIPQEELKGAAEHLQPVSKWAAIG